jgi:hypothetical protein
MCLAPALPLAALRGINYVSSGLDVLLGYEVISRPLHKSSSIVEKLACILGGRCVRFLALDFDIGSGGHGKGHAPIRIALSSGTAIAYELYGMPSGRGSGWYLSFGPVGRSVVARTGDPCGTLIFTLELKG